jgi:hypothetical protein
MVIASASSWKAGDRCVYDGKPFVVAHVSIERDEAMLEDPEGGILFGVPLRDLRKPDE